MNTDDIYSHRACERCHAQKLKCRPETEERCIRCTKANTNCVMRSPRRTRKTENPPKRRRGNSDKTSLPASPEIRTHSQWVGNSDKSSSLEERCQTSMSLMDWSTETNLYNLNFSPHIATNSNANADISGSDGTFSGRFVENDWVDFKFDSVDYPPLHGSSGDSLPSYKLEESPREAFSAGPTTGNPAFSKEIWVEDLTRLNSRVSKHDEVICGVAEAPVLNRSTTSDPYSVVQDGRPLEGKEGRFLDDLLVLTTDLIRLLDQLVSHTGGRLQNEMPDEMQTSTGVQPRFLQLSNDQTRQNQGFITPPSEDKKRQSPIHGDQFTILLLMSCYMRLLGIYENFFSHIQQILGNSNSQDEASQALLHLPAITVGSFSLHSSPTLKISMIIELVSFLVGHIGHSVEMTTPTAVNTSRNTFHQPPPTRSSKSSSAMTDVISSTQNAVREREQELMEAMGRIRQTFIRSRPGSSARGEPSYF